MPVRAVSAETAGTCSPDPKTLARRSARTVDARGARSCAEGKAWQLRFVEVRKGSFFTLFLGAAQAGLVA